MTTKLYLSIGAVVLALLAWIRYDWVSSQLEKEKLRADDAESQLSIKSMALVKERQNTIDAEHRAEDRQKKNEELKNEYDKKIKCINDGNCGVVVRYKAAICATPSVRSTDPRASGFDAGADQNQRDFARWYATLESAIDDNYQQIKGLQQELAVKSYPLYCQVTK